MKNNILLSIIISTKNKPWSVLSRTLDSIVSSDFNGLETILVDQNMGNEIESEIKGNKEYASIQHVKSPGKGLSKGRNLGISRSLGSWLLFFDDDAVLSEGTLQDIAPLLVQNQGERRIFYGSIFTLETNRPYLKKSITMGNRVTLLNFDTVPSIAFFFNRCLFDEIGLFDENLGAGMKFGGGEESDIIIRALKKQFRIDFTKDFKVYHPSSDISLTSLTKRESYGMGFGALYRKHMFSSPYFFSILFSKFALEILIRTTLVLISLGNREARNYHYYFFQGIMKGFLQFNA